MKSLKRIMLGFLIGIYLTTQVGCASLKRNYTVNGIPVDDGRTAQSGQTATDAGSKEVSWWKRYWPVVVMGGVLLVGGIIIASDNDDDAPC